MQYVKNGGKYQVMDMRVSWNGKNAAVLPVLLVIISFGPYVEPRLGIRVEHIVIYALFAWAVLSLLLQKGFALSFRPAISVMLLFLGFIIWTSISTEMNVGGYSVSPKVLSYFEGYFQPLAVAIVIGTFLRVQKVDEAVHILVLVSRVYVALLCINTLISFLSIFKNMVPLLQYFVGITDINNPNVWLQSNLGGRLTGIFSEPFGSGISYSLGAFLWLYLRKEKRTIGFIEYGMLLLLFIGGLLSISKAFIIGGIPLFLLYAALQGRLKIFLRFRFLLLLFGCVGVAILVLDKWIGLSFLVGLLNGSSVNLLSTITGTRFSSGGSSVMGYFADVWDRSPIAGFGFGSILVLDNAYLQYFAQGGVIALALYASLLYVLGSVGYQEMKRGWDEGRLMLIMASYVVLVGTGGPIITARRYEIVFWTVIMLMFFIARLRKNQSDEMKGSEAVVLAPRL